MTTPLYTVPSGQKDSTQDLNQLTTLLNGTGGAAVLVSNRIAASVSGTDKTMQCGYVGGTYKKGDKSQNIPSTQPNSTVKPSPPVSGTFAKGDYAADQAGLFWISTAATSGTTPWISIGRGGDSARTRGSIQTGSYGGGSPLGHTQNFSHWIWGGLQYNWIGGVGTSGFLIPVSGYYNLTATVKATGMGSNSRFTVNWIQVTTLISSGDQAVADSGPTGDAGSFSEDILFFNAGAFIAPFVTQTGATPILGTAPSDPVSDVYTVFAVVQLLSASASA